MTRRLFPACAALCAAAAAGCSDPAGLSRDVAIVPSLAKVPVPRGQTTRRTLTIDGMEREFFVHVGGRVSPGMAVPVVFMLHGTAQTGAEMLRDSRWVEKADTAGFIAVFPSALWYCYREDEDGNGSKFDRVDLHATTKWTQGALGTPEQSLCDDTDYALLPRQKAIHSYHPFQDDMVFIDGMIADLTASFTVDPKRIYATGFSNGGEMVSRLEVERSWVFAALASHAGDMRVAPAWLGSRTVSFVRSVGNRDDRFFGDLPGRRMPVFEGAIQLMGGEAGPYLIQGRLTSDYAYGPVFWDGDLVGRWHYSTSLVASPNTFTFLLIGNNHHSYPHGEGGGVTLADRLWPFFRSNALP